LIGAGWHHVSEVDPQKAGSIFDWQGDWWDESTLFLPGCSPLGYDCLIVCLCLSHI
jgi:hypothetical protein